MTTTTQTCACCGHTNTIRSRKIHTSMALKLVRLYRLHGQQEFHLPTALNQLGLAARDEAMLQHWGLLEAGAHRGWWRVTDKGAQFILGEITVPRIARVGENSTLYGFEGDQISIQDALEDRFDLAELLNS